MILRILLILLLCSNLATGQLRFPKGFKLVKGENGTGIDDYYTNGSYAFSTRNLFVDSDFKITDSVRNYLSSFYGFQFKLTKDSFYVGTGLKDGYYHYVIVTSPYGNIVELSSNTNDKVFSNYSIWLLSAIRYNKKNGKDYSFPIQFHKLKD